MANILCVCNVPFTEHKQTPIIHKPSVKGAIYPDRFFYNVLYVQQPLPDCYLAKSPRVAWPNPSITYSPSMHCSWVAH